MTARKPSPKSGSRLYRFCRVCFGCLIRRINCVRIIGAENEPDATQGPYLLVSNHIRWTDPIWLAASLRWQQPFFMAKKELVGIPVLGAIMRALGVFPIDRNGVSVSAVKKAISMLENGKCVGVFPQGHRNPGKQPADTVYHSGAAMIALRAGVPFLPVLLYAEGYRFRPFRRKYVIVGKPITAEELHYVPGTPGEYERVMKAVFERICALEAQVPGHHE